MPTSEPDRSASGRVRAHRRAPADPQWLAWRLAESLPLERRRQLVIKLLEEEDGGTISFRRGGVQWTAFTWDVIVSSALFVDGSYHGAELAAVAAWMARHRPPRDDAVVIDVGAHIGTSAIPLARAADCRVLAIEPEPDNFALLGQNVRHNGLEDRIACVRVAIVAEGRDRVDMILPGSNSGGAEVVRPGGQPSFLPAHPVRGVVEVPASRLDAVLDAHRIAPDMVPLVWSDTQGREADVICSAPALWAGGVPLYTEFDPDVLAAHGGTEAFLQAANAHFAAFAMADQVVARGGDVEVRPIGEFSAVCRSLRLPTNALLIPRDGRPR